MVSAFKIIRELKYISIFKTFYYNFISPHVKKTKGGIIIYKRCKLYFEKGAEIYVRNGILYLGRCYGGSGESLIRLQENSRFIVNGKTIIEYGADVLLKPYAQFIIQGDNYFNCRLMIRCNKMIEIGENGYVASGVEIHDSDGHKLNGIINEKEVVIGKHVWICSNVEVLKGVTIGNGTVIGAKSLVTTDIDENSVAFGIPAIVRKRGIEWEA